MLAFAIAGFAMTLLQSIAFFRLTGHSFGGRASFGYDLTLRAPTEAPLFAPPVHPETVAGYLELRALGPLAIVFGVWALVSALRTSAPVAFAISAGVAAAAACAGIVVGVASGGESVGALGLLEAGLLLIALACACYAVCRVAAQLTPWPALAAAGVLLVLFFLNSLSRTFTQLDALRWLSPFRYYDLSTPLAPGGRFDLAGFGALLVIAIGAFAAPIFRARALRARATSYESSRATLLAFPVARELYVRRAGLTAWGLAFVGLAVVLAAASRTSMQDVLAAPRGLPGLTQYIFALYAQTLDETWFEVALLMSVALVIALVLRWAADDQGGQLEAVLSAPYSRSAVVLERFGCVAVTAAVLAALGGMAVAVTSGAMDLALDTTRLVTACVLLFLFTVAVGAAGLLFASWAPRAAAALIGGLVLAAYLDDQIGAGLGLPGWLQNLSPFRLVDDPLGRALDLRNLAVLALLVVAGLGSSILAMQRRDVGAH